MKAKLVTPFTSWINFILTTRPWIYLVLSIHFVFVLLQTQLQSERMYFIIRRQSFFYQFSQVTFVEKKVGTRDPSRQRQRFRHDRAYESLFAAFQTWRSKKVFQRTNLYRGSRCPFKIWLVRTFSEKKERLQLNGNRCSRRKELLTGDCSQPVNNDMQETYVVETTASPDSIDDRCLRRFLQLRLWQGG